MKGDIQKFNNYKKVQENFEEVEEFVDNTKDDNKLIDVDNDGDLDSPEEIEAGVTHVEVETEVGIPIDIPTSEDVGGCNVFIINASEDDEEIDGLTANLKKDCACKEIHLYQLNIKDTNAEKEPKDGMEFIYNELEGCDAIVFASNEMNDSLKTCLKRMKNHYAEGELKNKIFGAIIDTEKGSLKEDLTSCAINDFQMIVSGDCVCCTKDKTANNISNLSICLKELCEATSNLRESDNNGETIPTEVDQEIRNYGEFVDEKQVEDPQDSTLEDDLPEIRTEDHDDFIDDLKGDVSRDLALPEAEEEEETPKKNKKEGVPTKGVHKVSKDKDGKVTKYDVKGKVVTEEEERLIDNLDGTITDINKGWEDTNRPKGNLQKWEDDKVDEEEEIVVVEEETTTVQQPLPFAKFNSTSWKKYQESKSVNEYNYDEWSKVTEDEEEIEISGDYLTPELQDKIDNSSEQELGRMLADLPTISLDVINYILQKTKDLHINPPYDSKKAGFEHTHDNVRSEYKEEIDASVLSPELKNRIDNAKNENEMEQLTKASSGISVDVLNYMTQKSKDLRKNQPHDNVSSENEEEIVEEEDIPNMELEIMPYGELSDTIENEDSLSIGEVDAAMKRAKELGIQDNEKAFRLGKKLVPSNNKEIMQIVNDIGTDKVKDVADSWNKGYSDRRQQRLGEIEEYEDDILDFDGYNKGLDNVGQEEQSYTMPEPGQRVRMIQMSGDPDAIEPGEEGIVDYIDDAMQIHMLWDNGRRLAIIPGVDKFEIA